jgi:hypothetical protein
VLALNVEVLLANGGDVIVGHDMILL